MKNKKLFFFSTLSFLFLAVFILNSCRNFNEESAFDLEELTRLKDTATFSGSATTAIAEARVTLEDLLPDTIADNLWIQIDANKLIHFRYKDDSLTSVFLSDFVKVPDLVKGKTIPGMSIDLKIDTLKLKLKKIINGTFFLADPRINIILKNYMPISPYFSLNQLEFIYKDASKSSLTGGIIGTKYMLPIPAFGGYKTDTLKFNKKEYPSLPSLFSGIPEYLSMKIKIGLDDFVVPYDGLTGKESIKIGADIDIPLDLSFENFEVSDTMDFDLSADLPEQIKKLNLILTFENGFPIHNYLQIYFAPELANGLAGPVIDSLFTVNTGKGWELKPATTDNTGVVTTPVKTNMTVELSDTKIKKLKDRQSKKIILKTNLNLHSTTSPSVKILSNYKLGVRIAAKVYYQISVN